MKLLKTAILGLGILLAGGLSQMCAAPTMRLSADGGVTWITVVDDGPLDSFPVAGFVQYNGPIGGWDVNITSGFGSPIIGSSNAPYMDLGTINRSSQPQSLIVQLSDRNFVSAPNQTFVGSIGGFTAGAVTSTSYRDLGNVLFGTTSVYAGDPAGVSPSPTASALTPLGPFVGGDFQVSNAVVVATGATPYSLTIETVVVHTTAGQTDTDSVLYALPPPPCNCTLAFNSPSSITNCAGDTIPDVVASQNCGNGPVSVPVTLVSAATNGVCPQIITRTYNAIDSCGNVSTFTQKITVNCNPNCTITLSTTNVVVGGSNYTASVANAGPSATYNWFILNGSITGGLGTPNITWAAGTDTNSPITIVITITAATGCQSTCSASVRLTPKPPQICLSSGDTATIGFWHNKNGQALILSAPNSPALGNWLASNFPCMYGSLAGKPNSTVAALFMTDFNMKGQKTYAQVLAGAFAVYFTSSNLAGNGAAQYGFNVTPGGTGVKVFNVGSLGTTLGLQNNTSYTVLQLLQAANSKCPFNSAVFDALNTIFDGINTTGDIK